MNRPARTSGSSGMKHRSGIMMPALLLTLILTGCGEGGKSGQSGSDVDLDLTKLSSTMVYSEVYNMVTEPDPYEGKTVRMHGTFDIFEEADSGEFGYTCVIADATACCAQGIPFVRKGDYSFPEDYPDLWSEITVVGTFDIDESGGYKICRLVDSTIEEVNA